MNREWFGFAMAALATWRVAHLVAREDGPFDAIVHLRLWAGDRLLGRLMDCPYCVSVWVAAPAAWWALAPDRVSTWVLEWLAVSGAACLVERWFENK